METTDAASRWEQFAERGSLGAIRLGARVYELLGRRVARAVLHPIAAYFFVRERASRAASRRYLERIWAHPDGRPQLRGRPGFFAPYWHYYEFALQILDRMVLWGHGLSELRMDHAGSEHLFALQRERRGGILLSAHLGSFDMPRQLAGGHGLALNAVMFTAHAERINRFFESLDPSSRVRVLSPEPDAASTALRIKACLDRGELVGIMADRLPAGRGDAPIWIDFLGLPMAFPLSPFRLACLLGAPALPLALPAQGRRALRDGGAPARRRGAGSASRPRRGGGRARSRVGAGPRAGLPAASLSVVQLLRHLAAAMSRRRVRGAEAGWTRTRSTTRGARRDGPVGQRIAERERRR
jgi:predicted LPLAT superfamily acyltransferase